MTSISPPPLRRLLKRARVTAWLNNIQQVDPTLQLAIVTPDGVVFAATDGWPADELAAPAAAANGLTWQALAPAAPGAFLVLRGGRAPAEPLAAAIAEGFALILQEALAARGLAAEALERYREINLLYRVGETIGATLDSRAILPQILTEAHQVIDADFGMIVLRAEETDWRCAAAFDAPAGIEALTPLLAPLAHEHADQAAIITEVDGSWVDLGTAALVWAPLVGPETALSGAETLLGGVVLARQVGRDVFLANDLKLLTALASQAAIALDKANLFAETQTAAQHLQAMNTIGRELAGTLEVEPLLRQILRAAIDMVGAVEGSLLLVEPPEAPEYLVFRVGEGGAERLTGTRLPVGTGVVGQVANTGEAMIVNAAQENKFWSDTIDKSTGFVTESLLAVPMIRNDLVVGVLEVVNTHDGRLFRQSDVDRLLSFSAQAVVALETARLHEAELTKERLERELQLGHAMQSSLIPTTVPALSGWEFAAWWQPAREVSGDFYDFVSLDDGVSVVIADVADKGVHAALFMSLTRSTVRASLNALHAPARSINEANRLIVADASDGMFVTLCQAHFKPDDGEVVYVNAGHNPPYLLRQGGGKMEELGLTGVVMGFDAGIPADEARVECRPGDVLLFYTDGITEAMNAARDLFGEERLQAVLRAHGDRPAAELMAAVKAALKAFIGAAVQSDDITVVIARRM